MEYLDQQHAEILKRNPSLQALRIKYDHHHKDTFAANEELDKEFIQTYLLLLSSQRSFLHDMKKDPDIEESLITKFQEIIDLEEEKLKLLMEGANISA